MKAERNDARLSFFFLGALVSCWQKKYSVMEAERRGSQSQQAMFLSLFAISPLKQTLTR